MIFLPASLGTIVLNCFSVTHLYGGRVFRLQLKCPIPYTTPGVKLWMDTGVKRQHGMIVETIFHTN